MAYVAFVMLVGSVGYPALRLFLVCGPFHPGTESWNRLPEGFRPPY